MLAKRNYVSIKILLFIFVLCKASISASQFDPSLALAYGSGDVSEHQQQHATSSKFASSEMLSPSTSTGSISSSVDKKSEFMAMMHKLIQDRVSLANKEFRFGTDTLLHYAIKNDFSDEAKGLITYASALNCTLDTVNKDNETALHIAVRAKYLDLVMIRMLVKAGANKTIVNVDGKTPLDLLKVYHRPNEDDYAEILSLLDDKTLYKHVLEIEKKINAHTEAIDVLLKRYHMMLAQQRTLDADLDVAVIKITDLYDRLYTFEKMVGEVRHKDIEKEQSLKKLRFMVAGVFLGFSLLYVSNNVKKIKKKLESYYQAFMERCDELRMSSDTKDENLFVTED